MWFAGNVDIVKAYIEDEQIAKESIMAEGSRLKHKIMLYVEQLSEEGDNFRAAELFQGVDKIHTKMVMQEMSAAEYVVLLKDILTEIASSRSNKKAYVFARKESKVEIIAGELKGGKGPQGSATDDQQREIGVFTRKENKERAYVFAKKESRQFVKDAENNSVKKAEGNSVGDVERVAYVFARKESKDLIEDNFVKGCEDARILIKDEEEAFHVFARKESNEAREEVIRSEDHGKEEVNEEAKGEVVPVVKDHDEDEARGEARPMVRDRDVESKEEIIAGKLKGGKRSRSSATDEKEIAVFTYKEDKKELGRVEKAENEEAVDQQKRKACLLREDCSTVGVGEGSNWDIEGGETVKIKVVCEIFKEEFNGEKTGMAENCSTVGVQEDSNVYGQDGEAVKSDVVIEAPREEILGVEDVVVKYVQVNDAKKAGKTAENRENSKARVGVHQVRKCGTNDTQSVSPVSESSVRIVERVGVFAAESKVFKSAVGAGPMYSHKHGDNRHAYSQSYEMNGGKGAGDLKQPGRLDVVERGSPLEQLLTDVSQVEEPDGLTSAMDPVYTKKYKADKHMYRKKYRVDSGQGAKVLEQPGRLHLLRSGTAHRSGHSQVCPGWRSHPSWGSRTCSWPGLPTTRTRRGWCRRSQEILRKVFQKWGCSVKIDCLCVKNIFQEQY